MAGTMVSRRYGWFPGWLGLVGWLTGTPGVAYALAQYFAPYVGLGTSVGTIVIVTIAILLSWMIIHLVGLKLAAVINNASVVTEITGSLLVGVGLLIYALLHHVQDFSFLTAWTDVDPSSHHWAARRGIADGGLYPHRLRRRRRPGRRVS